MFDIDPIELILLLVNLFVLYLILRRFLFGPLTRIIERRQELVREQMDSAKATQAQAAQVLDDYEARLAAAGQEAREILQNAKTLGEREYQSTLAAAKAESQALLTLTATQLEREREEMLRGVRREVAALTILAAAKVSSGHISADLDAALVDAFLDEMGEET